MADTSTPPNGDGTPGNPLPGSPGTPPSGDVIVPGTPPGAGTGDGKPPISPNAEEVRIRTLQSQLDREKALREEKETELEKIRIANMSDVEQERYKREKLEKENELLKSHATIRELERKKSELNATYQLPDFILEQIKVTNSAGKPFSETELQTAFDKAKEYNEKVKSHYSGEVPAGGWTPPPPPPAEGIPSFRRDNLETFMTKEGKYASQSQFMEAEPDEFLKRSRILGDAYSKGMVR